MSDKPYKCWKILGKDVATGSRKAIHFFCAQEGTFKLSFSFYVRSSVEVVKRVSVLTENALGQFVYAFDTYILSDKSEAVMDASHAYQTFDEMNLYDVYGDCSGCGCDVRTHCRVPCPGSELGYCCLEKEKLKDLALLLRDVSANRR